MRNRQVHLDFHTSEKIGCIGEKFSKEWFQEMLKLGHVNSITLFSKCHHGWAYHPSDANEMHPHLKFDLLGYQIEAAHEIGVKTPVYLSAAIDQKYAVQHPDHIKVWEPGRVADFSDPHYEMLCMNTPYLETFLAQIKEVLERYDTDGIFLDFCGVHRCYCKYCLKDMESRGFDCKKPSDVKKMAEEVFENFTQRVRKTIDSVKPGHPLFLNDGHIITGKRYIAKKNTHLELESLPTGGWGYDHFVISAAYARTLDMDYLGMTGKFHESWGEFGGYKHPNALRYEVALSVANGASVSIGDQLHPLGKMDETTYRIIGQAYEELEKIEPWLDKGSFCSDIAILSQEAMYEYYEKPDFDFIGRNFTGDIGAGRMLIEGQFQFDVIDFEEDFNRYKVIILPDLILLDEYMVNKLKNFTQCGGKILASGISGVNTEKTAYALDFGAEYIGESEYQPDFIRPLFDVYPFGKEDFVIYSKSQKIELDGGRELAQHIKPYFNRTAEHFCSHRHAPSSGEIYGAGIVEGQDGVVIPWNIFEEYATHGSLISKLIVHHVLNSMLGDKKTLETSLPSQGVATLIDCGSYLRNHLLYAAPIKRGDGVEVIEEILPIYDIRVKAKVGKKKIKSVYAVPQKTKIAFEQNGDVVSYVLKKLENHQLVILDTAEQNMSIRK